MINGFIIVNKKRGITSAKVVAIVKHLLYKRDKNVKIGHLGTLDPDGEGVLPIAIGSSTKLFSYLLDKKKTYYTEFRFGIDSDTLDTSGKILKENAPVPTLDDVRDIISEFIGKSVQIPPLYSARCYKGKRGYDLAREGADIELEGKEIEIYSIEDLREVSEGVFSMTITCSGGTYIRSIARDMGKRLGTCAVMQYINRVKSGCFDIRDSVTLKELESDPELVFSKILPIDYALKNVPEVKVTRDREIALLRGFSTSTDLSDCDFVKISCLNETIALGKVECGQARAVTFLKARANRSDASVGIALGFFDGIHTGHARVIEQGLDLAGNGSLYVSFFKNASLGYINKRSDTLFTESERFSILSSSGCIPFELPVDESFYKSDPITFLDYIRDNVAPDFIVSGSDFRFGLDAAGNVDLLKSYCRENNIVFEEVALLSTGDTVISTSGIKELLKSGNVSRANELLQSKYFIEGVSAHGRGVGRKLGYPTLNVVPDKPCLLGVGVYSADIVVDGNRYRGVVNVGTAPTFDYNEYKIEAYVVDTRLDFIEHVVKIYPRKFLREIKKFDSTEELIAQIASDVGELDND